jgi:hypothetical protein
MDTILTTEINEFNEVGYISGDRHTTYSVGISLIRDDNTGRSSIRGKGETPSAALAALAGHISAADLWVGTLGGEEARAKLERHQLILRQLTDLVRDNETMILATTAMLEADAQAEVVRFKVLTIAKRLGPVSIPDLIKAYPFDVPKELILKEIRRALERRELDNDMRMRIVVGTKFPNPLPLL